MGSCRGIVNSMSSLGTRCLRQTKGSSTRPACYAGWIQQRCAATGAIAVIEGVGSRVKEVTELVAFGGKIFSGMGIGRNIGAHSSCDFNSRRAHGMNFFRIIGHQLEFANVEEPKDSYRERIIAQVDCVSKLEIGFSCVEPLILQLIGAEFFNQADAATFLKIVDKHSSALFRDCTQGQMKLLIAITPHGVENLTSHALRMNADEWRGAMDISESQGKNCFRTFSRIAGAGGFKGQKVEICPAGGEDNLGDLRQRHQCGRAPFRPFVCRGGTSYIDPFGKRISQRKNACLQNVLKESFICRK